MKCKSSPAKVASISSTLPAGEAVDTPPDVLDDPLMYLPEVERLTRKSATSIWRAERAGKFPLRHRHGGRVVWFRSQIVEHLKSLREAAVGPGPAPTKANEARRQAAQRRREA